MEILALLKPLIIDNIVPIVIAIGAFFLTGKAYMKGRKHAAAKADRQLQDAYEKHSERVDRARSAADRVDNSKLRTDDGFKRSE